MFKRYNSDHVTYYEKSAEWLLICFNLFGLNLCTRILGTFIRRAFPSLGREDITQEFDSETSEDEDTSDDSSEDEDDLYEELFEQELQGDQGISGITRIIARDRG